MRIAKFYATTALTVCLASPASMTWAQTSIMTDEDLSRLSPLAQMCIANPQGEDCGPVLDAVSDCAADMNAVQCEVLFDDPDAVFASPEETERAQELLRQIDDEMAALDGTEPEAEAELEAEAEAEADTGPVDMVTDVIDDATDAVEGLAEEIMPPDEDPAPEAQDTTPEDEAPVPAEQHAAPAQDDTPREDTQPDDAAETAAAMQRALEEEEAAAAELEAEAEADAEVEAEVEAEVTADEGTTAEIDEAAEIAQQELEAERARLLEEADAQAQDAPELVIEDAPEEEIVAPADTPRELDADQQAAIDRMLEDPSVSSAVGLLGAMLGTQGTTGQTDAPDDAPAAATMAARDEDADADTPEVSEERITAAQTRSSRDDFESRLALDFDTDAQAQTQRSSSNRRDLERAGLAALGALAVGMVINQNRVVARSDERVVVDQGDGQLQLWRDDDAILLEDGSTRRIERYSDGSTRTRWERLDGTQILTIRDATGRVLRRDRVLPDGTIIELVDDTRAVQAIDVSVLPPPRTRELRITQRTDPELALAMLREAEAEARALDREFSLRQIREIRELRETLPLLSPDPITFETNRANVRSEEASKLLQVGRLMERLIADNPREIFLIEGHTDATGPAAFNLALSDRRAESVALALTEFFDIPPENLVVQGYGKRYLRIQTLQAEERNRRVAIRRITPLLGR